MADVRWQAEDVRVVQEQGRAAHLEVYDAHGDYSPWWERVELAGRDAVELRRIIDRLLDVLSRQGARP
ncbi:hypothetical protein ACN47A_24565 [Myxococcus fulvus]|uniref:hypothetical protein n=1 Tax=Myxococcus fulvus TaxID=33 RepID=UPI003B9A67E0